jgi:hypothetical protein
VGDIHITDTDTGEEFYVVSSLEQDGLVFQLVVPKMWVIPVAEGTVPSMMCHPQVLVTRL